MKVLKANDCGSEWMERGKNAQERRVFLTVRVAGYACCRPGAPGGPRGNMAHANKEQGGGFSLGCSFGRRGLVRNAPGIECRWLGV